LAPDQLEVGGPLRQRPGSQQMRSTLVDARSLSAALGCRLRQGAQERRGLSGQEKERVFEEPVEPAGGGRMARKVAAQIGISTRPIPSLCRFGYLRCQRLDDPPLVLPLALNRAEVLGERLVEEPIDPSPLPVGRVERIEQVGAGLA
jgi:hypothetical protein